ncbi:MAG: GNAT family N-acetyltransferase [Candidatus Bathyarchaeia archaeon]
MTFPRIPPERYIKGIEEPNNFYFVAEENGRIIGIAMGTFMRGNEKVGGLAVLKWICVHPSHQGKGVGKALLNHVIEYCKQQECHKITLYSFQF